MNIRTRQVDEVMATIYALDEKAKSVFNGQYQWDRMMLVIKERLADNTQPDRHVIDKNNPPGTGDSLYEAAMTIDELMITPDCRSSRRREGPAGPRNACAIWFDDQHLIGLAGPPDDIAEAILLCAGMALNIFSWHDAHDIIGPHDRTPFETLYADMAHVTFSEG